MPKITTTSQEFDGTPLGPSTIEAATICTIYSRQARQRVLANLLDPDGLPTRALRDVIVVLAANKSVILR